MKKILVANIFGIGDVLFTTPLIANLKKAMPGVSIDYLCNARTKEILNMNPDVDNVLVYEKDDLLALWKRSKTGFLKKVFRFFGDVRRSGYDAVFDMTMTREFAFWFFLAGIPKRIGFDYKRRGIFLTHKLGIKGFDGKHVIEYSLDLLRLIGIDPSIKETQLSLDDDADEWAKRYLSEKKVDPKKFVAIVPGGGASWGANAGRKRIDPGVFAIVAGDLASKGYNVGILGDTKESELCRKVAELMGSSRPAFVETGIDLKKYTALLSSAELVLCNDGGPLHMAVALKVKTVSLFGPVDEKVYGPYPEYGRNIVISRKDLECRPCYYRFRLADCGRDFECVKKTDTDLVLDACFRLLGKR